MKLAGKMAIIAGSLVMVGAITVVASSCRVYRNIRNGIDVKQSGEIKKMEYTTDASGIEELDVAIISERVDIKTGSSNEIKITYNDYADDPIYEIVKNQPRLSFARESTSFEFWNIDDLEDIMTNIFCENAIDDNIIIIEVPKNFVAEYDLSCVSGNISTEGIDAKNMNAASVSGDLLLKNADIKGEFASTTVSGEIVMENVTCEDCEIATTSGEMMISGLKTEKCSASTTSGDVRMKDASVDKDINIESISGEVELELNGSEEDFNVGCESVSGYVNVKNTDRNAAKTITASTVSGDIEISFK